MPNDKDFPVGGNKITTKAVGTLITTYTERSHTITTMKSLPENRQLMYDLKNLNQFHLRIPVSHPTIVNLNS